jgi:3-deoxy-manno-octulosonate cytidylyltransferase (CMP-KDO synthetase)
MMFLGVIPARYGSTRFPGKPLAIVKGKSMIRRVYDQANKTKILNRVVVATDDQRIFDHVKEFGGEAIMTSVDHENGTSRCYEVLSQLQQSNPGEQFNVVINIQGDEPFIQPSQIKKLGKLFSDPETEIGTLAIKIKLADDLFNPNVVKVVIGSSGRALYFSRQAVPFLRDVPENQWPDQYNFFRHIGLYAYRSDILARIIKFKQGKLEKAEKLEQLRWLENGCQIRVEQTNFESIAVDTPEDLSKINNNR